MEHVTLFLIYAIIINLLIVIAGALEKTKLIDKLTDKLTK